MGKGEEEGEGEEVGEVGSGGYGRVPGIRMAVLRGGVDWGKEG